MPAPTQLALEAAIEAALKTVMDDNGEPFFAKRDSTGAPLVPTQLAEGTAKLIVGIASGLSVAWTTWQLSQTVVGSANGVTTGTAAAPVVGTLP